MNSSQEQINLEMDTSQEQINLTSPTDMDFSYYSYTRIVKYITIVYVIGCFIFSIILYFLKYPGGITDLKEDTRKYVADWATNVKPQGKSQIVRHGCKTLLRFVNVSFCNERNLNDNLKIILESYGVDKYLPFIPVAIDMVLGGSNSVLLGAITKPCCFVIPQAINFLF
ncbi:uncharacterized protein TNCT_22631 [Trichonephila clavata]|uniref:Uncharacterized protein n=1 Tax=Trichonephila clavata TaxID=2740835 RepID=A0A8X6HE71_TRICU|nr:uncharacterized protein TNCT_22631 [Trichonephila clavata]